MHPAPTVWLRSHTRPKEHPDEAAVSRIQVRVVQEHLSKVEDGVATAMMVERFHDPQETWIDAIQVSPADFPVLAGMLGLPEYLLASKIHDESFPRIDHIGDLSTIFLWRPRLASSGGGLPAVERTGLLLVCAHQNVVSMCRSASDLFERVRAAAPELQHLQSPLTVTLFYAILKQVIQDHVEVVRSLENAVQKCEEEPVGRGSRGFLERTFQLRREIQRTAGDLWHLKEVMNAVLARRLPLAGFEPKHGPLLDLLLDETSYLYETTQNLKEELSSIIELHINTVSFEMNKVMRVLAVVTVLAVVPSVVAGLLGTNLADSPWPLSLGQVSLGVAVTMLALSLLFYRKGWLRT